MSKESQPKKPRSTKKVTDTSSTAELEAKIAELEAKLSNLSSQVKHTEAPKPEPKPQPRPAASGPTHGTLPAGFKPAEAPKPEPAQQVSSSSATESGEVAPAYAKISSTGYTGNKYFATRKRLSYHPADKQFTGSSTTTTTAPPAPEPPKPKSTIRTTLPAGFKP